MNKYGVGVSRTNGGPRLSGPELLCQLKEKIDVVTLTSDLQPFFSLPWASQLPSKPITSSLGPYKTCAVVSSAGSLHRSGLGKEIGETILNKQFKKVSIYKTYKNNRKIFTNHLFTKVQYFLNNSVYLKAT